MMSILFSFYICSLLIVVAAVVVGHVYVENFGEHYRYQWESPLKRNMKDTLVISSIVRQFEARFPEGRFRAHAYWLVVSLVPFLNTFVAFMVIAWPLSYGCYHLIKVFFTSIQLHIQKCLQAVFDAKPTYKVNLKKR